MPILGARLSPPQSAACPSREPAGLGTIACEGWRLDPLFMLSKSTVPTTTKPVWPAKVRGAQRRRAPGFTLIEALIVAAILALLITLAMPSIQRARGRSLDAKCAANLRGVGHLIHAFANEHGDALAPVIPLRELRWSEGGGLGWDLQVGRTTGVIGGAGTVWHCPAQTTSYMGNFMALGLDDSRVRPGGQRRELKRDRWAEPARLALAYDIGYNILRPDYKYGWPKDPDVGNISNYHRDFFVFVDAHSPVLGLWLERWGPHREKYGVLFADGHSRTDTFRGSRDGLLWSGRRWW
jgi:prepilin-type N-terminal cleavage/methylation domain-containing protein/prepilin-type processing-associated H-X9-DG protein